MIVQTGSGGQSNIVFRKAKIKHKEMPCDGQHPVRSSRPEKMHTGADMGEMPLFT
jgi:hypothetical protein